MKLYKYLSSNGPRIVNVHLQVNCCVMRHTKIRNRQGKRGMLEELPTTRLKTQKQGLLQELPKAKFSYKVFKSP